MCVFFCMKNLLYIVLLILPLISFAQQHPQRTPEDMARKQTDMLVSELSIQDSLTRDTIYRMFLKFAYKRKISNTRAEAIQYMIETNAELQQILTPEQYQQFMNQQVNHAPHRPHAPHNRIAPCGSLNPPPVPQNGEDTNMLPPPLRHLPVSRL